MTTLEQERHYRELRLFLEEICCSIVRFHHVETDGVRPQDVHVTQEASLGNTDEFADIRIDVPGRSPYFIEVKYGYRPEQIYARTMRKYGQNAPPLPTGVKIILVVDAHRHADWPVWEQRLRQGTQPGVILEIWDEPRLLQQVRERFRMTLDSFDERDILRVRVALDQAKGRLAFGEDWRGQELQSQLLWHFGFWRLKELRKKRSLNARAILPPGVYRNVAVVACDICSFSSYVRDTRDDEVVRYCLSSFYSKTRYEILATGGMMYQFIGDEVIGLFGIPDRPARYLKDALNCARTLVSIGNSISQKWQRFIDRVQPSKGVHIGMTVGDIQVVSLRPFGRAHLGVVSDALNTAARLVSVAGSGEIVVSNSLHQGMDEDTQHEFRELDPVDARNLGSIKAWKQK